MTMGNRTIRTVLAAVLVSACSAAEGRQPQHQPITPERTYALLATLAHDSLEGRATGAPGSLKAARIIAAGDLSSRGLV